MWKHIKEFFKRKCKIGLRKGYFLKPIIYMNHKHASAYGRKISMIVYVFKTYYVRI